MTDIKVFTLIGIYLKFSCFLVLCQWMCYHVSGTVPDDQYFALTLSSTEDVLDFGKDFNDEKFLYVTLEKNVYGPNQLMHIDDAGKIVLYNSSICLFIDAVSEEALKKSTNRGEELAELILGQSFPTADLEERSNPQLLAFSIYSGVCKGSHLEGSLFLNERSKKLHFDAVTEKGEHIIYDVYPSSNTTGSQIYARLNYQRKSSSKFYWIKQRQGEEIEPSQEWKDLLDFIKQHQEAIKDKLTD